MAIGAGKYDKVCTKVREETNASLALIAVIRGKLGDGFSIQSIDDKCLMVLPDVLRHIARSIERDTKNIHIPGLGKGEWSTEIPSIVGWYWARNPPSNAAAIVFVYSDKSVQSVNAIIEEDLAKSLKMEFYNIRIEAPDGANPWC